MSSVSAYCPGAISCIFRVWENSDLDKMGSTGVGFTVDKGVVVDVKQAQKTAVFLNGEICDFPTVETVVTRLTDNPVSIQLKSELPIACGFGISGASALGTAFALNNLLKLRTSRDELIRIAHLAEIINKTGLGTVGTQTTGGFLIKTKPGIPPVFQRLPFTGTEIYSVVFDSLRTDTILRDTTSIEQINAAGDDTLAHLKSMQRLQLKDVFDVSYEFAKTSRLLTDKKVQRVIEDVCRNGGHASMHMVGHAVFSDTKKGLEGYKNIYELNIVKDTVRLL